MSDKKISDYGYLFRYLQISSITKQIVWICKLQNVKKHTFAHLHNVSTQKYNLYI